jgi:hypothetical protein
VPTHRATARLAGQVYHARIEQSPRVAYIAVWGAGQDCYCVVPTSDALAVMAAAYERNTELPDRLARIMRMAAVIFDRGVDQVSRKRAGVKPRVERGSRIG